ncbi:MAG: polyprenyl synthetase family protein [Mariprofundaceae bacterium]
MSLSQPSSPAFLAQHAQNINVALMALLDTSHHTVSPTLSKAMRYSLLAGGKRIRPALLLECYHACGGDDDVMNAALSIECIHTYSLIHDDLPCMDDDDVRRGMATCHRKFDEATAVLAADALQTFGFELLAGMSIDAEVRCHLISNLACAAGAQGMVAGQMLDMHAECKTNTSLIEVERIHLHKTGALLRYSCEAGAMLANGGEKMLAACSRYGKAVGLLFQIADDILDVTETTEQLGKDAGSDAARNKATYVTVLGVQQARELAMEMCDLAIAAIEPLGERGVRLQHLAHYILERRE